MKELTIAAAVTVLGVWLIFRVTVSMMSDYSSFRCRWFWHKPHERTYRGGGPFIACERCGTVLGFPDDEMV